MSDRRDDSDPPPSIPSEPPPIPTARELRELTARHRALETERAARELAEAERAILNKPKREGSMPAAVHVIDRIGDVAGTVCVTYLCLAGKITGTEALITICALLGGLQGLRRFGKAGGLGFLGILVPSAMIQHMLGGGPPSV